MTTTATPQEHPRHLEVSSEIMETLQAMLFCLGLQALLRDGKDAAMLHLQDLETGAAELHFLVRIGAEAMHLQANFCSMGASTPILASKMTAPKPATGTAH